MKVRCGLSWILSSKHRFTHKSKYCQLLYDSVSVYLLSIKLPDFSLKCFNFFSGNQNPILVSTHFDFIPKMIYNIQLSKHESLSTDLLRRNPKVLPAKTFRLAANLFLYPTLKTVGWPKNLVFISSLNAFRVLVIFTRYFNVKYGIWKRIIAPFRFRSLLMTLKSVRSLSFSVHFVQQRFFSTSAPSGMRLPKIVMRNKLSVTSRKHAFPSEMNMFSVTGWNSARYDEIHNSVLCEGSDTKRKPSLRRITA